MMVVCSKCSGNLENIQRAGQRVFLFCRHCKLPHDEHGNPLFTNKTLADRFNPLQAARTAVNKQAPTLSGVAKTALETAALQGYLEAYFAGIKDGVLLAYSQEYLEGEPMMEKLGVEKQELISELRQKYNTLKERQIKVAGDPLQKEAAASVQHELNMIQSKIHELTADVP